MNVIRDCIYRENNKNMMKVVGLFGGRESGGISRRKKFIQVKSLNPKYITDIS